MNSFGKLKTDGELVYPATVESPSDDDIDSVTGNAGSVGRGSQYSIYTPSLSNGTSISGNSAGTLSSSQYLELQSYSFPLGVATDFNTPRSSPLMIRCLFWFTDCAWTFHCGDPEGKREWFSHMKFHLTPKHQHDQQELPRVCNLCGGERPATWDSVFDHAYQHVRSGEHKSDACLVDYLLQRGIITPEQHDKALRPREFGRASGHRNDPRLLRNFGGMAYALRGIGRDLP